MLKPVDSYAADRVLDVHQPDQQMVSLTPYLAILEDPSQAVTFADVTTPAVANLFQHDTTQQLALNYGYTDSAYWLRLTLSNTGSEPAQRMLELANSELENLEFFQPDAKGAYRSILTGGVLPFASRPYANNNFVFPITLAAHSSQVFYLRIISHRVAIPVRLWTQEAFQAHERNYYVGQAWYFGIVMAMVIFNFFIFILLRDGLYLQYVGLVISIAFVIANQNGLAKEFMPFDSHKWSTVSFSISYSLSMFMALLFTRSMLNTRQILPILDRWMKSFGGLYVLNILLVTFQDQIFVKTLTLLVFCTLLLMMSTMLYCAFKRQRTAYFAVAAFTMPALGALCVVFRNLQILPDSTLANNGLQIGSAMEMLLLAFALADRFNVIRRKAIHDVNQANANLEVRLQMRETELVETHRKLREIEQRQTLAQERQRLMQDMHDGLGSSLVSALRVIEHGHMDESELALVLKGCIDDLKLAIDSIEPVEADLLLLLATFRYRLGPRLERTGITLRWEVGHVPDLEWLDPKNALHILRILQEVFTNIMKHAQATKIRVATSVENGYVSVLIADNGRGFDVAKALERGGKGLSNQTRRAEAIGARVKWKSNENGTDFELCLPVC